jgi:hypothetical protein
MRNPALPLTVSLAAAIPHLLASRSALGLLTAVSALLAVGAATAQANLLDPQKWTRLEPKLQTGYSATATEIRFHPYEAGLMPGHSRTGIEQSVDIPAAGTYAFDFRSAAGMRSTGTWNVDLACGAPWQLRAEYWLTSTAIRFDKPQQILVRILVGTSNLESDLFVIQQPRLCAVAEPAITMQVVDWYRMIPGEKAVFESPAHLLFASLRRAPAPIRIPGIQGTVELDPAHILLLAVAGPGPGAPHVRLDVSQALDRFLLHHQQPLPTLHLQALHLTAGLGSAVTMEEPAHR